MAQKISTKIHFHLKTNPRKQFSIRPKNSAAIEATNSTPYQKKYWFYEATGKRTANLELFLNAPSHQQVLSLSEPFLLLDYLRQKLDSE